MWSCCPISDLELETISRLRRSFLASSSSSRPPTAHRVSGYRVNSTPVISSALMIRSNTDRPPRRISKRLTASISDGLGNLDELVNANSLVNTKLCAGIPYSGSPCGGSGARPDDQRRTLQLLACRPRTRSRREPYCRLGDSVALTRRLGPRCQPIEPRPGDFAVDLSLICAQRISVLNR